MDESQALRALQDILARPEFQQQPRISLWQAFWTMVARALLDFVSWLLAPAQSVLAGRLSWLALAVGLLALLLVLAGAWFVARLLGVAVAPEIRASTASAAVRRQRSDGLWSEANSLAAGGDMAEAIRRLYQSALYALEEHDLVRIQESLTNREQALSLAKARPGLGAAFAEVVQRYDPLRYGGGAVTRQAFDDLQTRVQRLREASR